ncbi:receptor-type tyrosine-protein phosphatase gamma [Oryzias melastigma]|uniref:receptor-type tyrosine-protein phosphatase gamma n=1 Tax=Oryzias melastigma TaxID=30732 RepID=UPI000CF838BA|nr:receptor-type tyrosine-protein phosphatase gamma [Oryzias melastigma]
MWGLVRSRRCWIFSVMLSACALLRADGYPAGTERPAGIRAPVQSPHKAATGGSRLSRSATEEPYWAYSGIYGPDEGWVSAFPECREKNQSPINIVDKDAKVSTEYQELILEGFDTKSSNKTTMKNTGKTVAITLKDEYFVQGGGLPGRFKAEKLEFHWGPVNGSDGSEHSVDGRRFPVEMQIFMYNSDDFDSLGAALRQRRMIAAMAVFFQVGGRDYHAADAIIHGLKGVVHHEKETFLEPFVLKDLLPPSLGSYYRYSGSLTTPPCSKVVEWIIFSRPIYISYKQLEAFYSIFTTEQQDHVKSVEYLRSNFRPVQSLDNRIVFKSAVKDAWMPDLADSSGRSYGTESSNVCSSAPINTKVQHVNGSTLVVRWARPEVTYHPPILHFLVSYSWTAHDDSFEETHLADAKHKLEAIISPVSPDVLYLFRVQAICRNDMRSDFSQSILFRANTTRIFEGTRIVKTGMPTVSPASSADMAPISSGSSTWTSAGIPFSFVSMATGIGPSSSGSQATVASVVTSTLLAGLGFSGGVISSFPSSVWPSAGSRSNPAPSCQNARDASSSADVTAAASDRGGSEGDEKEDNGRKDDGDREDEEEEDKEKARKKKRRDNPDDDGRKEEEHLCSTNSPAEKTNERKQNIPDSPPMKEKQQEAETLQAQLPTTEVTAEVSALPASKNPAELGGVKLRLREEKDGKHGEGGDECCGRRKDQCDAKVLPHTCPQRPDPTPLLLRLTLGSSVARLPGISCSCEVEQAGASTYTNRSLQQISSRRTADVFDLFFTQSSYLLHTELTCKMTPAEVLGVILEEETSVCQLHRFFSNLLSSGHRSHAEKHLRRLPKARLKESFDIKKSKKKDGSSSVVPSRRACMDQTPPPAVQDAPSTTDEPSVGIHDVQDWRRLNPEPSSPEPIIKEDAALRDGPAFTQCVSACVGQQLESNRVMRAEVLTGRSLPAAQLQNQYQCLCEVLLTMVTQRSPTRAFRAGTLPGL